MADARASREEVLAWMADRRAGTTEAGRHFGIPTGTVKRWHHEAGGRAAKFKSPALTP